MEQYSFKLWLVQAIPARKLDPFPRTILAAEPAAFGNLRARTHPHFLQLLAHPFHIERVHNRVDTAPQKLFHPVAQSILKCGVGKLNGSIRAEDGNQFLRGVQQNRKLLSAKSDSWLRDGSLDHRVCASHRAGEQTSAKGTFGSLLESVVTAKAIVR